MSAYWRQSEPIFQIDRDHSRDHQPWPCCSINGYRIRSNSQVGKDGLMALFNVGLLGSGQEFRIHSQCDGKEKPAGHYVAPCVDDKTGMIAKNPYTGVDYESHQIPYYEYFTSTLCDSSD